MRTHSPLARLFDRLTAIVTTAVLGAGLAACVTGGGGPGSSGPTATVTVTMGGSSGGSDTGGGPTSGPGGASTSPTGAVTGTPGEIQVPVYYVAEALPRVGPRLYREFRRVAALPAGRVATAVTAMLSLAPLDPDYRSDWAAAGVTLRSATISGAQATIDLSRWIGVGAAAESMAVQQLVHTVTAADPTVTSVRILVAGAAPVSGHLDLSRPQSRGRALDTLALVWLLEPTQGAVTGSPVTVRVYGTGFEGHIPLRVFRDGTQVTATFVTTRMGELAEASTSIMLAPGSYEVRAYNENMESGALEVWDSKAFTVR